LDQLKLPKLTIKTLVIAVFLGVISAVIVYQAQINGLMPIVSKKTVKPESLKIQNLIQEENAVISVVEKSSPSIVSISLAGTESDNVKTGTGFVVDSSGVIITSKNIVSDFRQYVVETKDGQKFEVRNIYKDPNFDLSLLIVNANNLKALDLGDSSELKLGQTIIAMGQKEQAINVTVGVVSSLNSLIQTDTLIDSDNLGGPLLSLAGQVVGVNLERVGSNNLSSAIPINSVKQLIASINKGFLKPFLGLTYKFISKDIAVLSGDPPGAFIQAVSENGPADKVGIKAGDIIVKINGNPVDGESVVSDDIMKGKIGQQIELTVLRNGKELIVKAVLESAFNQ